MKFSLKSYLQAADPNPKQSYHTPKPSQTSNNPSKLKFESWLNSNIEQKNLKNRDMHIEEYEEIPEESLHPLDYRIEIERRFRNSVVNKIYIFPRKNDDEISISSDNSSLDSIKPVTLYELAAQNFSNYVRKAELAENVESLKREIPLGVNYKQFLNILEKTIKNVNMSDLKKIKMNNFFKREGNDIATPHFSSTTHKDYKQKNRANLRLGAGMEGKPNKTLENSSEKCNISKGSPPGFHPKTPSHLFEKEVSSKPTTQHQNQSISKFLKSKKMNINPRTQAISFTQNNHSQVNSPSYSINKA